MTPQRLRVVAAACTGLVAAVIGAGCGVTHVQAPVLTVVTSVYPLAQALSEVGAGQVRVVDLATANVNPRTMRLSSAQVTEVHRAALVVDIGDGFQPSVEAAAQGAPRVLALLPALGGTNPYIWLDPALMERASTLMQQALTRAEPAAKAVFSDGQEDLMAELSSLDIDFENSLADCPQTTFITSDDAFARMAHQYGVVDQALGTENPDAAQLSAAASAITRSRAVTAFKEPYVSATLVSAAAETASVKIGTINTIATPPATGSRAEVSYSNLMEVDLSSITHSLRCPSTDQN